MFAFKSLQILFFITNFQRAFKNLFYLLYSNSEFTSFRSCSYERIIVTWGRSPRVGCAPGLGVPLSRVCPGSDLPLGRVCPGSDLPLGSVPPGSSVPPDQHPVSTVFLVANYLRNHRLVASKYLNSQCSERLHYIYFEEYIYRVA